jgi:hypothetical protein
MRKFIFLLSAGILLLGCSQLNALLGTGEVTEGGQTEGDASASEESEPVRLVCPPDGATGTLTFNHDISWGGGGVTYGLTVQGSYRVHVIQSIATYDPGTPVGVHNIDTGPLTATLTVKGLPDCTEGSGETKMRAYVTGSCFNSQLTLKIEEIYEAGQVTVFCGEKKDKKAEILLPVGALEKPIEWKMSISSITSGGLPKSIPFKGMGAKGGWNYTFSMPLPLE